MPEFLEKKLKKKFGAKSKAPYKIMNSIGAMHGNKETSKGKEMEYKHNLKIKGLHSEKPKKKSKKKDPSYDPFARALNR